jgi:predicted anti-sigma-YlaC factor YlaD
VLNEQIIEISCLEVWREISNLIDGSTAPELQARIEQHFKGCKHCTAVFDGVSNTVRLVGDGDAFELPTRFTDRLFERLAPRIEKNK